jgi:hypothetical protein
MDEKTRRKMSAQLDEVLSSVGQMRQIPTSEGFYYPTEDKNRFVTAAIAVTRRLTGPASDYAQQLDAAAKGTQWSSDDYVSGIVGVLKALRDDIDRDRLESLVEILHADLFSDFLEQAAHLQEEGYKDAAAVIAGSVLEEHLRQLATKQGVEVTVATLRGTNPKKASTLNDELAKAGAYSKLDQKSVTAWLGIRNLAAHGKYGDYAAEQVALLIQSVRDFITRNPA